jgi:LysM repeat protein/soluble lytic murein transglycosylase-like protein
MPRTPAKAHALSAVLLLAASACATAPRTPTAPAPAVPAPAPAPTGPVQAPEQIQENFDLSQSAAAGVRSGLLGNVRYDLPVEANPYVQMELDFLVGQRRAVIGRWLERGAKYQEWVEGVFASYGIPRDLHHLAMVESGYSPTARSHAGAVGMWQFMAGTGRGMGLRIDDTVDERMDPVRATHAAARHLRDLHRDFRGDWALAAAAYNAGSGRINRGLGRFNATNFWDLAVRGDLAKETQHYVPRLYAVTIIGRDPARFGYTVPAPAQRFRFDSVRVDVETPLAELARIASLNVTELAELNPHLHRGIVPARYTVWTPAGSGPAIQAAFDTSGYRRSGGYAWYTLRRGENVAAVAQAAGITVEQVRALNLSTTLERLGTGDRVRLPAVAVRTLSLRTAPVESSTRLASAGDEPRGPSSPELDAARAERRARRAREAEAGREREARQAEERRQAEARRAEEREARRLAAREAERERAARRAAAEAEDDTPRTRRAATADNDASGARRASEDAPATRRAAASDDDAKPARRTSAEDSSTRKPDPEAPRARRALASAGDSARTRRADDAPETPRARRTADADDAPRTRRASSEGSDAAPSRLRTHVVERGETLRGLAELYGVTVAALREANDIASGTGARVGMRLRIPRAAALTEASERAARARRTEENSSTRAGASSSRSESTERTASRGDSSSRSASARRDSSERKSSSESGSRSTRTESADRPTSRTASSARDSSERRTAARNADAPRTRSTTTRADSSERRSSTTERRPASESKDSDAPRARSTARADSSERRSGTTERRAASENKDDTPRSRSTRADSADRRSSTAERRNASESKDSDAPRPRASAERRDTTTRRTTERSGEGTRPRASSSERASTTERSATPARSTSERPSSHTVKSGETLYSLARQYGTTVAALRRANDMSAEAPIQPGQRLRIPRD